MAVNIRGNVDVGGDLVARDKIIHNADPAVAEALKALLAERHLTLDEAQATSAYLACLHEQLCHMPLPLARRSGPEARTDASLTEVFVPLKLHDPQADEEARRGSETAQHGRHPSEAQPDPEAIKPVSLGEVLARHPAFLLTGPPGCGKTTLLRRAALAFAEGRAPADLGWSGPPLLPIFLRLRNFGVFLAENAERFSGATHGALTTYIEQYFQKEHRLTLTAGFFDHQLEQGRCLVLLDGLDEVAANRPEVAQYVCAFISHFAASGNRFGLASRPKGYEAVEVYLRPARLALGEVQPLDADGIRQLVGNLFHQLEGDPRQRASDAADLPLKLLTSRDLAVMAGTPLFCTALVLVYKYHGTRLPQRRVEVYQEIVDLLLGFWKAQERDLARAHELALEDGTGAAYADISAAVAIKKKRLAHLALWMQEARLTEVATAPAQAALADYLRMQERRDVETAAQWAENFLVNAHERSGLLVEVEPETHAFTQQGFREYLAATALKNQREAPFVQSVLAHAADDWWEQVILLAGAHPELSDSTRGYLIDQLLEKAQTATLDLKTRHAHRLLAGQCAVDMATHLPGTERTVVEQALYQAMTDSSAPPDQRLQAGDVLDALGWAPEDLDAFVKIQAGKGKTPKAGSTFFMGRYPVTNQQYARFLAAPDYADEALWRSVRGFDADGESLKEVGAEARDWFQKRGGKDHHPDHWNDARFGAARRLAPVVTVTWYEAAAYCAWLTRHWREILPGGAVGPFSLPDEVVFRLPLEAEWILAAGGEDGDRYPWQAKPEAVSQEGIQCYANTYESGLERTSPVCMYPAGQSLQGVMDMSGNVWEWQSNLRRNGFSARALRGGSWDFYLKSARVAGRDDLIHFPDYYWHSFGFRVVAMPVF